LQTVLFDPIHFITFLNFSETKQEERN